MIKSRKMTLENRIARLERLLGNKSVKKESRRVTRRSKNESALRPDMHDDLVTIFDDRFNGPGYYDSMREFKNNIEYMSTGDNDMMVDDAIMWLASDFGYDEAELEDLRDAIAADLAQMAADEIHDWDLWYEDEDEDWDEEDEEFESCRRRPMRRTKR